MNDETKPTRADEELHVLQLAAISTASIQNTETTVKDRISADSPYCTTAYLDVCRAIDREMNLRNELESRRADAAQLARMVEKINKSFPDAETIFGAPCDHAEAVLQRLIIQWAILTGFKNGVIEIMKEQAPQTASLTEKLWEHCEAIVRTGRVPTKDDLFACAKQAEQQLRPTGEGEKV